MTFYSAVILEAVHEIFEPADGGYDVVDLLSLYFFNCDIYS